jgi:hypothetical protein
MKGNFMSAIKPHRPRNDKAEPFPNKIIGMKAADSRQGNYAKMVSVAQIATEA